MQLIRIDNRSIIRLILWALLAVGMVWLAFVLRRPLAWFGGAGFLAVALNPAVGWISRRIPGRSRLVGAILVLALFVLLVAFLAYTFIPALIQESPRLLSAVPGYVQQLQHSHSAVGQLLRNTGLIGQAQQHVQDIAKSATGPGNGLMSSISRVFSGIAATGTVLAVTFFMLLEGPTWVHGFWQRLPESAARRHRPVVRRMYEAVTGYVSGNLLTSLLLAILTAVLLSILKVPDAVALGIVVGLFDLVPMVGATIGSVIAIMAALFTSLVAAIIATIFFVVYQQVENHVVQPLVYSKTIQMSPLLVLMSAVAGASVGGIMGAVVAIPVGACLRIVLDEYVFTRRDNANGHQ